MPQSDIYQNWKGNVSQTAHCTLIHKNIDLMEHTHTHTTRRKMKRKNPLLSIQTDDGTNDETKILQIILNYGYIHQIYRYENWNCNRLKDDQMAYKLLIWMMFEMYISLEKKQKQTKNGKHLLQVIIYDIKREKFHLSNWKFEIQFMLWIK